MLKSGKQYACVTFLNESDPENESVAEVPLIWLNEDRTLCKWPSQALVTLYTNRYKKPLDTWESHGVRLNAIFDSLEEARKFNSVTLNSEEQVGRGCRAINPPEPYSPAEFVEIRKSKQPMLPPTIGESFVSFSPFLDSSRDSTPISEVHDDQNNNSEHTSSEKTYAELEDASSRSGSLLDVLHQFPEQPLGSESGTSDSISGKSTADTGVKISESQPKIGSGEETRGPCSCNCQERVLHLLADLKLEVASLTERLKEKFIEDEYETVQKEFENLPLKTLEELQRFEIRLNENQKMRKKLFKLYQSVGGLGSRDFITRCLKKMLSNEAAEFCSWTGQKDNYKISESPFIKILKAAAKNVTGVTERDFEISVKDWLRHAKQRRERQEAKVLSQSTENKHKN